MREIDSDFVVDIFLERMQSGSILSELIIVYCDLNKEFPFQMIKKGDSVIKLFHENSYIKKTII